jgi:phage gp16-like protein
MTPSTKKQRQLIGIACGRLGIDKATKEDMLTARYGKSSTCDISRMQAEEFLRELGERGFKVKRFPRKPNIRKSGPDKADMLRKIEAYLAEAGRPWAYVHGMAKHMFAVDRVEWCEPGQLHKIVAALEYDARRHGRDRGPR